jgi:hypothetical protein
MLPVSQLAGMTTLPNLLHTQTAMLLRLALSFKQGIVVTDVSYQVE